MTAGLFALVAGLVALCEPARPLRGERVTCLVRAEPRAPLHLLERKAVAEGEALVDPLAEWSASGESRWAGPAVVDTTVSFRAEVAGREETASAAFQVRARGWEVPLIEPAAEPWAFGTEARFGGPLPRLEEGSTEDEPLPAGGALVQVDFKLAAPDWQLAAEGPNARWYYLTAPPPSLSVKSFLHPALRAGGAFTRAQHGDLSVPTATLWPHCRQADLAEVRLSSLRSAGALPGAPRSQLADARAALLQAGDAVAELEGLHGFIGSSFPLKLQAKLHALVERAAMAAREAPPLKLPCSLRWPKAGGDQPASAAR